MKPARHTTLEQAEDRWLSRVGGWLPQEGRVVYQGHDLFAELSGLSWTRLLMLGITGRTLEEHELAMLEAINVIAVSYPDPRIWCNRVAALAGTTGSTGVLGVTAALAAAESEIIGQRVNIRCIDWLLGIKEELAAGASLADLVARDLRRYRGIPGYGRPVFPQEDERIEPMMKAADRLGYSEGEHVSRAFEVERILLDRGWPLQINISGLVAALAADIGLCPMEYYSWLSLSFAAGMVPCFLDALEQDEGSLFPLRCSRIEYTGEARRRRWQAEGSRAQL